MELTMIVQPSNEMQEYWKQFEMDVLDYYLMV